MERREKKNYKNMKKNQSKNHTGIINSGFVIPFSAFA